MTGMNLLNTGLQTRRVFCCRKTVLLPKWQHIQKHENLYIERIEDGIRVKLTVLQCQMKRVQGEARIAYNNVPELFVTE